MDEELPLDRTKVEITFDPHLFNRQLERNLDIDFIEETVKTGSLITDKSKYQKFCFKKYQGKQKITYIVVTIFHKNFIEVRTAWRKKGKI